MEEHEHAVGLEARKWFRHQVEAHVYYIPTNDGQRIDESKAHLLGNLMDVSEKGFKFKGEHPLEPGDQISFEIVSGQKTIFSGVAVIKHKSSEPAFGTQYLKIRKH